MKHPTPPHHQPQNQPQSPDSEQVSDEKQEGAVNTEELLRLQEEVLRLQGELHQKEEVHLRAFADLQNVRRRANEERLRLPQLGAQNLLIALLPTFDHLELALKNRPTEESDWTRGVEAVYGSFLGALQAEGIERICAVNVPVDPNVHEVITTESGGGDTVIEIFQSGYRLGDKVIRVAKVKAGQGGKIV